MILLRSKTLSPEEVYSKIPKNLVGKLEKLEGDKLKTYNVTNMTECSDYSKFGSDYVPLFTIMPGTKDSWSFWINPVRNSWVVREDKYAPQAFKGCGGSHVRKFLELVAPPSIKSELLKLPIV